MIIRIIMKRIIMKKRLSNEGNAKELEIPYFSFTEENIVREENRR